MVSIKGRQNKLTQKTAVENAYLEVDGERRFLLLQLVHFVLVLQQTSNHLFHPATQRADLRYVLATRTFSLLVRTRYLYVLATRTYSLLVQYVVVNYRYISHLYD